MTPHYNDTTHASFESLDFITSLDALAPKPGVNLTRNHRIFAPKSQHHARVIPAKWSSDAQHENREDPQRPTPTAVATSVVRHHGEVSWCTGGRVYSGAGMPLSGCPRVTATGIFTH